MMSFYNLYPSLKISDLIFLYHVEWIRFELTLFCIFLTKIGVGVTKKGVLLKVISMDFNPLNSSTEALIDMIETAIKKLLVTQANIDELRAIGVGCPGQV